MNTRIKEKEPDECTDTEIEHLALYRHSATEGEYGKQTASPKQHPVIYIRAVEYGNDKYAPYIVNYGKRGEKYLKAYRHSVAKHSKHSKREGYIGRHGYGGSSDIVAAVPDKEKYCHRHHHATQSSHYRE